MGTLLPMVNPPVPVGAHLIDGDWTHHAPGGMAVSGNPARPDEPVGEFPLGDASTAADAVAAAVEAQASWASAGFGVRARIVEKAGSMFDERANELAVLCTLEEGKTLSESRGEASLSAETCRYQAGLAKTSTERIFPSNNPGETIRTVRAPLGVVGVVTPWNFPILIPVWKIVPALVAGNSVVWKPASYTPLTAVAVAGIFKDAGVPPGVLNLVLGPGATGGALVADERVDGVTFTGSVGVGQEIRKVVTARNGRVQLELGGHNPCIVFADADLDIAVSGVVNGAMGATGQKCTATRRIIAVDDIHDELVDRLATTVSALKIGDGQDAKTAIGPLVSAEAQGEVAGAVEKARVEGAETIAVTEPVPDGPAFFAPTLFTGSSDLTITREEVFGPVSTVIRVDDEDEAFALANDTEFGLSASVYTDDPWIVNRAVHELQAGLIKINGPTTGSEIHAPFGGEKGSSGHAPREQGDTAQEFFTRTRTAYIKPGRAR